MIGKIKVLGLAVVAMAAMGAFSASAAQAGEIDIGVQPASLFAHSDVQGNPPVSQKHTLTLLNTKNEPFNTVCPTASFEGTTQGQKINEATVTATYGSGCTAFGVGSQVLMNGCKFTVTGALQPANTALVDVVGCTPGKKIEIKTAICVLGIPEQNGLSHITGTNINAQQVTVKATVSEITVIQTGAACPDGHLHNAKRASFTGNTLLAARTDVGGHQVTRHSHQYQELTQTGAPQSISFT